MVFVGDGKGADALEPFWRRLRSSGARIAAVENAVTAHCPQAKIVYDLFPVLARYGRTVIDRVRVDAANRVQHDTAARKVIKGAKWLLLANRERLNRPEDQVRLDELLAANETLMTVYVMKDDRKQLWRCERPEEARSFLVAWCQRAADSAIAPLNRFAARLRECPEQIINHCLWPLHTSLLEGINNRIKVIKRVTYDFRDDAYFFLKIRAAFPGIPG